MLWRVVFTDTEGPTGVAPVCDQPEVHADWHAASAASEIGPAGPDNGDVYDCCPQPHIECWAPSAALTAVGVLNEAGAVTDEQALALLTAAGIEDVEYCT